MIIAEEYDKISSGGVGFFAKMDGTDYPIPNASTATEIELGFEPKEVVVYFCHNSANAMALRLDVANSKVYRTYLSYFEEDATSALGSVFYASGTKVYYKASSSPYVKPTIIIATA